jgi:hypothetical protein|tara:strand:+ start:473 stop:838 length:366 start_codon:yes stop_codon:yes gene_type:complete
MLAQSTHHCGFSIGSMTSDTKQRKCQSCVGKQYWDLGNATRTFRARTQPEPHGVVFLAVVQVQSLQRLDNRLPRREPLHAFEPVAALVVNKAVLGEHVDELQVVSFPRGEIVRVVRGGYFN